MSRSRPGMNNNAPSGLAIFGVIVSAVWFPIAFIHGKRYENVRGNVIK
jgi:hypothetical protein